VPNDQQMFLQRDAELVPVVGAAEEDRPQVQPDTQVPGAVAGQVAGGQERPGDDDGQD
jgi:hypothetical protein